MNVATSFPDLQGRQRRITVDEYHRMIAAGLLGEDEHVQLIAGTLVAMTPQGSRHAVVIQRLTAALVRAVGGDLAVVRAADAPFDGPHPRSALLVVEVAGDSLRLDRESKATLYARAGIPEYWIVNLAESAIEAHSEPDRATGVYRSSAVVACGETLVARSVPNLTIDVASLFG